MLAAWKQRAQVQGARHSVCIACCSCNGGSNLRLQRLQLILLRLDGCLQLHSFRLHASRASLGSSHPLCEWGWLPRHGAAGDAEYFLKSRGCQ